MSKRLLKRWVYKIARTLPLRSIIVVPFVLQTFIAVGLTGWLSLRHGQEAVNEVATQLRSEISDKIRQHLSDYLKVPNFINQINAEAVAHYHFDINDSEPLEEHLLNYIRVFPSVKSILFVSPEKTFIEANKLSDDEVVLLSSTWDTNFSLFYHNLDSEGRKARSYKIIDNFDPRQELWYKNIIQGKGKPVWSETSENLEFENELSIIQGIALYDDQQNLLGITAVKLSLDHISQFLQELKIGQSGQTFILDQSGILIASSLPEQNSLPTTETSLIDQQNLIPPTLQFLKHKFDNFKQIKDGENLSFKVNGEQQFVQVVQFNNSSGLQWLIVVVIPESDFMDKIYENTRITILLCIVALLVAILLGFITSRWMTQSIQSMSQAAAAISQGDWNKTVVGRTKELFDLAEIFNNMAKQLQLSFAALQQREANLTEAQKVAHIGSWEWDLNTQNFTCSDELFMILGQEKNQLTYDHYFHLIHPDDQQIYQQVIHQAIETGYSFELDYRMIRADGLIRYVYGKGQPTVNSEGKTIRLLGTLMDISERKLAEKALKTSETELKQKTQQLEQTLEELQKTQAHLIQSEKMSSLGQLVAGIAHEINNPVSFIYGNIIFAKEYAEHLIELIEIYQKNYQPNAEVIEKIEAIELDYLLQDFPKLIDSIKMGADRIQCIVKSLRNFSRLDESPMKDIDIHEGIENTLLILQSRLKNCAEKATIEIIKDYGTLPKVECYAGLLNQVFMNILANAIDATEEYNSQRSELELQEHPSWIKIKTEFIQAQPLKTSILCSRLNRLKIVNQDSIMIRIQDNGPGIPEATQKRLFDPFFTTKPLGKGTGLGLSISYQIITEKHRGQLQCLSEVGVGTEFIITIPLSQSHH
ncbi:putative Histidine kinase [Planktothrix serta PCC 8927]|uniref:histidine kinase n=1 Tax=Planktothrix serta PCC 8927 TaxID=671068 RepID=A0A7Z9BWW7_9CYAN|nr:ATP-binding protein [Planktothrix serta]VXD24250.1 putative Histidine kinase [Planktothrix serta PCC 8927]